MEWKPIETAPKDGTEILICSVGYYSPRTACWASYHPNAKGKETWRTSKIAGDKLYPTHWMPLPELPKEQMEEVSNCCGYAITENTDLCSRCGEHCAVEIFEDE